MSFEEGGGDTLLELAGIGLRMVRIDGVVHGRSSFQIPVAGVGAGHGRMVVL